MKLIITEFATVNTIMKCLFKSNIRGRSLKMNDVFYNPFPPNVLRAHFCTATVILYLSLAHQLGWLQKVTFTSLRNHEDVERSPISKPGTGQ